MVLLGKVYGLSSSFEGAQYKYYKNINASSTAGSTALIKSYNSKTSWYLRSVQMGKRGAFCVVGPTGVPSIEAADTWCVLAPGFAI